MAIKIYRNEKWIEYMTDERLQYLKSRWENLAKNSTAFLLESIDMPDIACKKCGREIYCGVNSACSDPECEKKTVNRNKE